MKKVSSVNSENISKLIYNIKEITSIKKYIDVLTPKSLRGDFKNGI